MARQDGTTKRKEIIFKIVKERDEEYFVEESEEDEWDSSKCESVSQSSGATHSTCSSDTNSIKRTVSADP